MLHLIINKESLQKKSKRFENIKKVFEDAHKEYVLHVTDSKQAVHDTVQEITSGTGNSVIIIGGDGTLHDAINAFVDCKNNSLGLIPFGTGNDFAEAAGIPTDEKKAAKIIVEGTAKPIDYIQFDSGLRCMNAFGMGIDVDVLKRAYAGKNKKRNKYMKALIVSLAKFKSYNFIVRYNGKEEHHYGLIAAVGNGKQFGGGIKICPKAKINDGILDLTIADYISKFRLLGAFIRLVRGKVDNVKQITSVKVKEVEFIPETENFTFQVDGELYKNVPIKVKVVESGINFYMN